MTGRRVFLHREYVRLMFVENLYNAYHDRKKSDNWAAWATTHPQSAAMLADVEALEEIDDA